MQYPVDYLKKESAHSEVEQVAWQQKSILKRFKRSGDDLGLPEGFGIGEAVTDGNCFFDSFRQGLEQQLGIRITVEQLRNDCREFAQDNPPGWFISAIANSHDNSGRVRSETIESYIENIPNNNRWGDPDIEGRILCKKYNVKLHIAERQPTAGWIHQIIDKISSSPIGNADYSDCSIIHIINEGRSHFVPIKRLTNSLSEDPQRKKVEQEASGSKRPASSTSEDPQRKKVKPSESEPQDFELIELLIQKPAEIGMRTPPQSSSGLDISFKKRFQSFINQMESYLHSVNKPGFFTGMFSALIFTAKDSNILSDVEKIYFCSVTAQILKIVCVKKGRIESGADVVSNVRLISISESYGNRQDNNKEGKFTSGDLENILKNLKDQAVAQFITDQAKARMEYLSLQITKTKDGISVTEQFDEISDLATEGDFREVEKGISSNLKEYVAAMGDRSREIVERNLGKAIGIIDRVHFKYKDSIIVAQGAREAAHHGFVVGSFLNFRYRYNIRFYIEKNMGNGCLDIGLSVLGHDRSYYVVPAVLEMKVLDANMLESIKRLKELKDLEKHRELSRAEKVEKGRIEGKIERFVDNGFNQAEGYVKGLDRTSMDFLTLSEEIVYGVCNLDLPGRHRISSYKLPENLPNAIEAILEAAFGWNGEKDTENVQKGEILTQLRRINNKVPHVAKITGYFGLFLMGQLSLLNEFAGSDMKVSAFLYDENPLKAGKGAKRGGDYVNDVRTLVLTRVTENEVLILHVREGGRGEYGNKKLPTLTGATTQSKITEVHVTLERSGKRSDITVGEITRYNSLTEYENGAEFFRGELVDMPYPDKLEEAFSKALHIDAHSSSDKVSGVIQGNRNYFSISDYGVLIKKIGEWMFPFRSFIIKEANFQAVLYGALVSYAISRKEKQVIISIIPELQVGGGGCIDIGIRIMLLDNGGKVKSVITSGLELKGPRRGKNVKALVEEVNSQIQGRMKDEAVANMKAYTDGELFRLGGVVYDAKATSPEDLLLLSSDDFTVITFDRSSIKKQGVQKTPVYQDGLVDESQQHSASRESSGSSSDQSEDASPQKKQKCSEERKKRSIGKSCIDSRDEESAEEKKGKEELIKELFDSDEIREKIKNVEFYDQLFKVSDQISKEGTINEDAREALMTKVRDIDLDSIDPEIKDIVKEIKEKINKEEIRTILTRTGVTEKIEKVAESAGLSRTVFLAKNNKIQEYVDKINSNPEVMNHLNRIGKISGGIMQGMMYKNLIDDILSDNYKGVAINLGFIAGGPFLGKLAEVASARGAEFTLDGRLILGRALKTASPFIARATSAFIIYDLVNQVKELKAGNKDALVGVVGDGIYLGVDVAEVGIELAEFAGILEGVSSVTGPIGAAIGAIVFVGTDIYLAVRTVEKEDKIIHLTGWEKFKEGWRAFLHIPPEQYMKELIGEKEANNQLVKSGIELLKRNTDIQRYVFPTGKSVVGSCRTIEWQVELCDKGSPINGVCPMGTGLYKTYKYEECNTKIQLDLESSVDFGGKMDIYHSRASPDNPEEGELFCLPLNTEPICHSIKIFNTQWGDCQPSNAYYCNSAIGVSYTKDRTGNYTLIALGKGKDTAVGFKGSPNIFLVEDGEKYFWGGDEDDIFVLSGSEITGILDGGSGDNTIDFGGFRVGQRSLLIDPRLSIDGLEWINMNNILGREGRRDVINFAPNVKHIDGRGGKDENAQDLISIDDCTGCYDEVQVAVRPYTHVENRLSLGNFTYVVHQGRGESSINIMGRGKHSFLFNYTLQNIEAVSGSSWNVVFIFSLSSNLNDVSISRVLGSDISYTLSDGTEIRISNEGDLYALQNTDKQVDEIIKDYPAIANMLNMTIVVQSSNESIIIGHGKHEVLHDNPEFNSHLVGNGGENIYVIAPTQKKINIYDVDEESSIDTLNLRDVMKEAQNISLKVSQSGNDLLIKLEVGESLLKFPIRIKNGTLWYKKLHVVGDSMPMQINKHSDDAWNLSLAPLTFDDSIKIAVITAKDVGEGNKLIVRKRAGQYAFSRLRDDLIIITDPSLGESNACTILLSNFYKEPKMKTLFIDFEDIRISLQKKMRKIDEAVAFCPRVLQMNKEFSVNGSNLLSSYDCLKFNSDEILFLRLDNSLLLLSDKGKLLMSNYYSDVHEKWSLPVELNDNIITSEEFRKRANNPSSFRYYQMNNQQTLKIYHNQPENKHYVGLVDLKDKSILKYRVKIFNNDLVLSLKNGGIIKVENWVNSESSKIIFVFSDAIVSNEKCIVSTCNPEDIVKEFEKERVRLVNEKGKDINVIPDYVEKSGSVNVDNSIAWSTYPQEERNEESKQRYRRHHIRHEDHHRGHRNHRSPIQEVTSSAVKPSSWINVFTNTIVDAVKGVSRFIFSPFKPAIDMEHSQPSKAIIAQGIDTNGTLLLLDVFIRKITGQKYISNNIRSICEKEAQIYALPIAKGFEQALEGAAIESGIPVTNLKFNPVEVFLKVAGQIRSGKFSEISKTLYSSAKEACPEFEQTGEFLVHVKSHLEEFLAKKETVFLQQKQTADQPTSSVSRKVVAMEPSKKPDTFLSDTSVVKGIKHVLGL